MPTATAPAIASSSSRLGKLSVRVGWSRVLQVDDLQRKLLYVDKRIYMVKSGRGVSFRSSRPFTAAGHLVQSLAVLLERHGIGQLDTNE
jgi:hypothetical protein